MTRSDEPLFEPRIADWLEDDPYTAPDQALDVVLAAFPSIKQRRAWRVPWRVPGMTTPLRLGLTAAAAVAVAIGGIYVLNRGSSGPNVGGQPAPTLSAAPSTSPAASPSADPLDTATWSTYVSSRYGFSIGRPGDWTERPATRDWTLETDATDWTSPAQESFISAAGDVRVSAWSLAVEPGTSVEAWIQAYCEAAADPAADCAAIVAGAIPIFVEERDRHPGLLQTSPAWDMHAFVLNGDRMHVVAIWRLESDPTVAPYGGARRLLESFLSTMVVGAPEATSAPPS